MRNVRTQVRPAGFRNLGASHLIGCYRIHDPIGLGQAPNIRERLPSRCCMRTGHLRVEEAVTCRRPDRAFIGMNGARGGDASDLILETREASDRGLTQANVSRNNP